MFKMKGPSMYKDSPLNKNGGKKIKKKLKGIVRDVAATALLGPGGAIGLKQTLKTLAENERLQNKRKKKDKNYKPVTR